ncbi:MAG: tail fiber domain-containing protein, partial [Nitrospirae bacterium]|nr:tail fiber domain-containing protein [Nitrospirota bacterium]
SWKVGGPNGGTLSIAAGKTLTSNNTCTLACTDSSTLTFAAGGTLGTMAYDTWPCTTLGDIIYGGASGAPARLAGNTTTMPRFLTSTGASSAATAPTWTGSTGAGSVVLATSPKFATGIGVNGTAPVSTTGVVVAGSNLTRGIDSQISGTGALNHGVIGGTYGAGAVNYGGYFYASGGGTNWGLTVAYGNANIGDKLCIGNTNCATALDVTGTIRQTTAESCDAVVTNSSGDFSGCASVTGSGGTLVEASLPTFTTGIGVNGTAPVSTTGVVVAGSNLTRGIDSQISGTGALNHGVIGGTYGAGAVNYGGYFYASGGGTNWGLTVAYGNANIGDKLCIGNTNCATALDVTGTIRQTGAPNCGTNNVTSDPNGGLICGSSDARLKTNVLNIPYDGGLVIDGMRPVFYHWTVESGRDNQLHAGFIAQDVRPVLPGAVTPWTDSKTGIEYYGIDSLALLSYGVLELQHLRVRVGLLEGIPISPSSDNATPIAVVTGGLQFDSGSQTKPDCTDERRGTHWFTRDDNNVDDVVEVCAYVEGVIGWRKITWN